jgi:N,N'-diacetyllegionaminate synthase
MTLAKKMIDTAKECGADIAKFQLYDVDRVFPEKTIVAQDRDDWYPLVKKTQLTYQQTKTLASHCKHVGIEFMASASDLERLSWLKEMGVKRHKIATRMNWNIEYINAVAKTGKQMLVSTREYLQLDVEATNGILYLYCVPSYPTKLNEVKLGQVDWFKFHGFSDHTIGVKAAICAMARGAIVIEKHFTLDRADPRGPDHMCSADPTDLTKIVCFARKLEEML